MRRWRPRLVSRAREAVCRHVRCRPGVVHPVAAPSRMNRDGARLKRVDKHRAPIVMKMKMSFSFD